MLTLMFFLLRLVASFVPKLSALDALFANALPSYFYMIRDGATPGTTTVIITATSTTKCSAYT